MRYLLECFLGTRPKGEIQKCLKEGERERASSVAIENLGQKVLFKDIWLNVGWLSVSGDQNNQSRSPPISPSKVK